MHLFAFVLFLFCLQKDIQLLKEHKQQHMTELSSCTRVLTLVQMLRCGDRKSCAILGQDKAGG